MNKTASSEQFETIAQPCCGPRYHGSAEQLASLPQIISRQLDGGVMRGEMGAHYLFLNSATNASHRPSHVRTMTFT
jgi:hypothetical protein